MISVILPTLNAAAHLRRALPPLVPAAAAGLVREVIVSDGGSSDATAAIADAAGARFVESPRGRGAQLRAGAGAARGAWFLFLHADTALDPGWAEEAARFIEGGPERAGAFRFAFDDQSGAANRVAFWAHVRCALLHLPYGDQGLLISRALYEAIGGYADLPLFEDVDIVRRLGRRRLVMLRTRARTSAEKYRRDGFARRGWRNLGLLGLYLAGVPPKRLARLYD